MDNKRRPRPPQLAVPVHSRIHKAFQEVASKNFENENGQPETIAGLLHKLVCDVVAIYSDIDHAQALQFDLDLSSATYSGPTIIRKMLHDWKTKHPNWPEEYEPEQAKPKPKAA